MGNGKRARAGGGRRGRRVAEELAKGGSQQGRPEPLLHPEITGQAGQARSGEWIMREIPLLTHDGSGLQITEVGVRRGSAPRKRMTSPSPHHGGDQ